MSSPEKYSVLEIGEEELALASSAFQALQDMVNEVYLNSMRELERRLLSACLARENKVIAKGLRDSDFKVSAHVPYTPYEDTIYYATWRNELVAAFTLPHFSYNAKTEKSEFKFSFLEMPM